MVNSVLTCRLQSFARSDTFLYLKTQIPIKKEMVNIIVDISSTPS